MTTQTCVATLMAIACTVQLTADGAEPSVVIPYLNDDVVAVAYVDLNKVTESTLPTLSQTLGIANAPLAGNLQHTLMAFHDRADGLVKLGATRVFAIWRVADLEFGGPGWVMELNDRANTGAIQQLLGTKPVAPRMPRVFRPHGKVLLAARNERQLEKLTQHHTAPPRKSATEAMQKLGSSTFGLLLLGDADSRRVIREMLPTLPPPFEAVDGRMIADDLLWGGVTVDLVPSPKATLHIETSRSAKASDIQMTLSRLLAFGTSRLNEDLRGIPNEVRQSALKLLSLAKPMTDESSVVLTIGEGPDEAHRLARSIVDMLLFWQESAAPNERMQQFKSIAIALLNYESVHGELLRQASYDASGRPLLSWRVHVLPYLEQDALYKQFHLDEPWDSPHNRTLVVQMPEVFAEPNVALRARIGEGRTTYVAPVAKETYFPLPDALPNGNPLRIRDITDGTSQTIQIIEVAPEHAVVWTKPEDWNVDLDDPLKGVFTMDHSGFVSAYGDGSAHYMTKDDVSAAQLRALLTRNGAD